MPSTANVFYDQAAGYERWVLNNWESLEVWERDQYRAFIAFATDKKRVQSFVTPPPATAGPRAATLQDSLLRRTSLPRTVSLAYALILTGSYFFPMIFLPVALLLAVVNVARGRWDHGLIQIALGGAVLALHLYGMPLLAENYPGIYSFMVKYR